MTLDNSDSTTNSALQGVLMAMIDPINQVFFHSRMLRAWGHSEGMARNMEWIFKMRRTGELVGVMHKHGVGPCDRPALDIAIGHDARSVLEADAAQGRWFIALVEDAHEKSGADDAKEILSQILAAERADLALLESWLQGREADEVASNVKHLRPKPGGEEAAIAALNAALPAMTSAVSQVFFHSLIFKGQGNAELAQRDLEGAVIMMYRSEALLERLLDLGGLPSGSDHGKVRIGKDERDADEAALETHDAIMATLESSLATLSGTVDPMTHSLVDGIFRAVRDDRTVIASRLAA